MIFEQFERTNYGLKHAGNSRFVIVAPHAAGDDWKTARVARRLAEKLGAALVINKKFFRPTNKKANQREQEFSEDFNKLCWSPTYNKYLWKRKHLEIKHFYKDIAEYCQQAKAASADNRAIVVYIHGMAVKKVGIDLGVGLRAKNTGNRFLNKWERPENNSGVITIKISQLKKLRALLQKKLEKDYNLAVSVGKKYIGWSKQSAIQFHKHVPRNDFALQIEINRKLRQYKNLNYLVDLLADSLRATF
ncbi:hypothetical protein HY932_00330 [Candidatus Falkowbacteria bacterium]|nr:hypothetical protein [Candidatus Falkowbacteria bacterium]